MLENYFGMKSSLIVCKKNMLHFIFNISGSKYLIYVNTSVYYKNIYFFVDDDANIDTNHQETDDEGIERDSGDADEYLPSTSQSQAHGNHHQTITLSDVIQVRTQIFFVYWDSNSLAVNSCFMRSH